MRCRFHQKAKLVKQTCIVQQEYKPFHVVLEDYLNGKVDIPQTDEGAYEFTQEGDVDFNKPLDSGHHDIYDVASGNDPVYKQATPVSDAPSASEAPSAPATEPSPGE